MLLRLVRGNTKYSGRGHNVWNSPTPAQISLQGQFRQVTLAGRHGRLIAQPRSACPIARADGAEAVTAEAGRLLGVRPERNAVPTHPELDQTP